MEKLSVQTEPLNVAKIIDSVRDASCGAISVFIGVVREEPELTGLDYETYDEMVLDMFGQIRSRAITTYGIHDMAIHHRKNNLVIGEDSVVIAASGPHRKETIHACEWAINELKQTVPIWKKTLRESQHVIFGKNKMNNFPIQSNTLSSSVMVDIGKKDFTERRAVATGKIVLSPNTISAINNGKIVKGDVFATAQVAGLQAVKTTPYTFPNCHIIPLSGSTVTLSIEGENIVKCDCEVKANYSTGVEMEALHGCTVALMTVWDMVKAYEKNENGQYPSTRITDVKVVSKEKVQITI